MNEQIGVPRTDPRFALLRRNRFIYIIRQAKKILKLNPEEKEKATALITELERGNAELNKKILEEII